jgi:addiction module RelE/StbE family toxin
VAAGQYRVDLTRPAERDLKTIARRPRHPDTIKRIDTAILALGSEPRPLGSIKLHGGKDLYRIVVAAEYRIVYEVVDSSAVVTVVRVRDRQDVYRGL